VSAMGFTLHSCRRLHDNAPRPRRSGRESRKAVYPNELTPAPGRASACHGFHLLAEVRGESPNLRGFLRATDVSGAGQIGGLQARSSGYSSGTGAWSTHDFYHADGNENITALVHSSQGLAAVYDYDPYGRTISASGNLAAANRYRFSSKLVHAYTGMYYYGYRFYDPYLQRWLNRDLIEEEGGNNLYEFVSNAPLNECDPDGRLCLTMYLCSLVPGSGNLVGTKIRCMYSCTLVAKVGFCKQRPDPGIFVIDAEPFPPPCNRFGQPVVCSRVFAFKVW